MDYFYGVFTIFVNNLSPVATRILQGRFLPLINSLYTYTFFQGPQFTYSIFFSIRPQVIH